MRGPRLDIKNRQMIRAIGRTGRVVDASDLLGLTPSALSHRIKEAERRLGVPLFERMHKRLRMTAAAEYLADVSERLMQELEKVEEEVQRMNESVDHVVRLSIETYNAYHWFPEFLRMFQQQQERISIQIMSSPGIDATPQLLNRHLDIAIVSGANSQPGCRFIDLFSDHLVFICAPDHRLAGRSTIHGRDIKGEKFITYTKVPVPDQEFAQLFRAEGHYPKWTASVELPEAIIELVAAGEGTSILANWAVAPHAKSCRIIAIPLGPTPIPSNWRCQIRADEPKSGAVERVANALRDWFSR